MENLTRGKDFHATLSGEKNTEIFRNKNSVVTQLPTPALIISADVDFMYVYINIYIYSYMYIHIYIYIFAFFFVFFFAISQRTEAYNSVSSLLYKNSEKYIQFILTTKVREPNSILRSFNKVHEKRVSISSKL